MTDKENKQQVVDKEVIEAAGTLLENWDGFSTIICGEGATILRYLTDNGYIITRGNV